MKSDRRTFIQIAALGTAGLVAGCERQADKPATATPPTPAAAPPRTGATLKLTLWGSCLYAFSNQGKQLDVAYLTADPKVPGCAFTPHKPMLMFPPEGGRIVTAETTVAVGTDGELPPGVYRMASSSLGAQATALSAIGLGDAPADCPAQGQKLESLGFVPTLMAPKSSPASWQKRFGTRIIFDRGEVRARAPFDDENRLARWIVKGPGGASKPVFFTDALELTLPLAGDVVTFESEDNKRLTIGASGNPAVITAWLMAHPRATAGEALLRGEKEPHFCALYGAFDPMPAEKDRAEIYLEDWCTVPGGPSARSGAARFSPGKYCTGGKIIL